MAAIPTPKMPPQINDANMPAEIIIAGIYCITAVILCILMQRKNLPELLLVLSSGHAVHWAGVNSNLLKKCNTETVPGNIETISKRELIIILPKPA